MVIITNAHMYTSKREREREREIEKKKKKVGKSANGCVRLHLHGDLAKRKVTLLK